MKRIYAKSVLAAAAVLGGWVLLAPAIAAPPTVTPSPGYDARLQEQRAAQTYQPPADAAVAHPAGPAPRHHAKRTHGSAH